MFENCPDCHGGGYKNNRERCNTCQGMGYVSLREAIDFVNRQATTKEAEPG